jgi:hypothetical protein
MEKKVLVFGRNVQKEEKSATKIRKVIFYRENFMFFCNNFKND